MNSWNVLVRTWPPCIRQAVASHPSISYQNTARVLKYKRLVQEWIELDFHPSHGTFRVPSTRVMNSWPRDVLSLQSNTQHRSFRKVFLCGGVLTMLSTSRMIYSKSYFHFPRESINHSQSPFKPEILEGWHILNSGALRAMLQWSRTATRPPRSLESSHNNPSGSGGSHLGSQSSKISGSSRQPSESGCSGSRSGSGSSTGAAVGGGAAVAGGAAAGSSAGFEDHSDTGSSTSSGSSDCWNDAGVDDWDW